MSAYVIGLTGGIACGKSNLSAALKKAGAPVIDADEISRALTAPGGAALPAIRAAWGDGVFRSGELDRQALAQAVFASEEERRRLNAILHPMIFAELRRQLEAARGPAVMDVPLLYETGLDAWCDEVWCAYVPQKEQIVRLRKRSGLTRAQALARIRSQMPALEKRRRADRVIRTDGSKEESAAKALQLWRDVMEKYRQGDTRADE